MTNIVRVIIQAWFRVIMAFNIINSKFLSLNTFKSYLDMWCHTNVPRGVTLGEKVQRLYKFP